MINKIAFAGCWHANAEWAGLVMRHAADQRGADVLVHTGDFGYTFDPAFVGAMERLIARFNLPIYFVDGNHDNHRWLRRQKQNDDGTIRVGEGLTYLPRGHRWAWEGVHFLALGGARSIDRQYRHLTEPPYWWSTETITPMEAALARSGGPVDVLVSHDAPSGIVIPDFDQYSDGYQGIEVIASQAHRQLLRDVVNAVRPDVIFHGHYHTFHTQVAELGYGDVKVIGLDRDGSTRFRNVHVLNMGSLRRWVGL